MLVLQLQQEIVKMMIKELQPGQGSVNIELTVKSLEDIKVINKYGKDIISKAVFKAMRESKNKIVVFNGVRLPIDCENLKNENGILVYITASSKLRWNRVLGRKEKADDGAPYNKFMEMQKAETEKYIPELGIQADYQIINDGTLEELENKVITLFQSIIEKH